MSVRKQLILIGAGIAVLLGLTYMFVVRPAQGNLAEVRTQVEDENSRTEQLSLELARLEGLKERAPEMEAAMARIGKLVPRQDLVPNFVNQVKDAADDSGLKFVDITPELPKPPAEGAELAQVRTTIGADGCYFSIEDFVRRLTDMDRAVRVDNFTLNAAEGSDEDGGESCELLTLQITARVFFELPAGSAGAAGTTTAPAPATSSTTTTTAPSSPTDSTF